MDRSCRAAIRRRVDLARDGDAQAALAAAQPPETWRRTAHWFDLADYLTWRTTGGMDRSLCTTVCKWTYLGHERPLGSDVLRRDRALRPRRRRIRAHRCARGAGRTRRHSHDRRRRRARRRAGHARRDIADRRPRRRAGNARRRGPRRVELERRLAIIAGTSACHLALAGERHDVAGVWGPYYEAILPGMWCTEAGISASGAFLDQVLAMHPARAVLGDDPFAALEPHPRVLGTDGDATRVTVDRHWQPGPRQPFAARRSAAHGRARRCAAT